jgi:GT2 family glycosyltransferase
LDERFFLYFEDVDFCIRLRGAGHKVMYEPSASAIHGYRRQSRGVLPRSRAQREHLMSGVKFFLRHPRYMRL